MGTKGLTEWESDGGPGKDVIEPSRDPRLPKQVPILILVDWGTCSRAEQIPIMFREAGIATVFGEQTAGADAAPLRISLPNTGWEVSFSVGEIRSADGFRIEGKGISPDIPYTPKRDDLGCEGDPLLHQAERALLEQIGKA
jgi:C-terminal processing protease CtpA/Prc